MKFQATVNRNSDSLLQSVGGRQVSFTDRVAFRLKTVNPDSRTVSVSFEAYDDAQAPISASTYPGRLKLSPGGAAISTVIVPLVKMGVSDIRICSIHRDRSGSVTNKVCGQYSAKRIALNE